MERKPTEENPEELKQQAKELYNKGLALLEDLDKNHVKYSKVEGIEKFRRRVQAEIDFLNNVSRQASSYYAHHYEFGSSLDKIRILVNIFNFLQISPIENAITDARNTEMML